MTRDAQASLRMPHDLKEEIKKIADVEHRSLSNTIELLLKKAVEVYWDERKPLVEISDRSLRTVRVPELPLKLNEHERELKKKKKAS